MSFKIGWRVLSTTYQTAEEFDSATVMFGILPEALQAIRRHVDGEIDLARLDGGEPQADPSRNRGIRALDPPRKLDRRGGTNAPFEIVEKLTAPEGVGVVEESGWPAR